MHTTCTWESELKNFAIRSLSSHQGQVHEFQVQSSKFQVQSSKFQVPSTINENRLSCRAAELPTAKSLLTDDLNIQHNTVACEYSS